MQGYRGNNCQRQWATYLIGLLTICLPDFSIAQQLTEQHLPWYIPQRSAPSRYIGSSAIIEYTSLQDLAEKLAQRTDGPYHLSIKLDKNPPAYWQQLRAIPPATSLAIELADSVMTDTLVAILASWNSLKRLDITGITGPRSYTIVTNAKGEKVFGSSIYTKRLSATGWGKLRSVQEVLISNEIDLNQAATVLRQLPALESLTIRQFLDRTIQNVPVEFAGLERLRKLTVSGGISWNYKQTFSALPDLDELVITDPDIRELNAGLPYLTKLTCLQITVFGRSTALHQLRLGGLTNLQSLYVMSRSQSAISLDSTLTGLTTLRRLSIEQTKLKSFPVSLLTNKKLTYLSMPDADLETIPDQIDQLPALEELILDNNPLHRLPAALGKLSRLNRLSVSKCELDSLPAAIGQLASLTGLSLNSNVLTALPASMGQLSQLRQLNVAMNQLTELPVELGTLPNLETIAAFWNKIARFPAGFSRVRDLYLTDNLLTELPAALGTLTHLRTLMVDNNQISSLPAGIGQLDSLQTLGIGGNPLTALPNSIGGLRRLNRLDLGMSQIRELPETIGGLTSLTSVSLKDMPLTRLPASIGAWRQVRQALFRLPQLESLPEEVGQWQHLESLTIESDRLLVLPEKLTDCQQLGYLSVTGKRLIGLPESIGKLISLSQITLDGRADSLSGQGIGKFTMLPAGIVNCKALTSLLVLNQQQFDGIEGMQLVERLPGLRYLSFVNCGLTELTGISWKKLQAFTVNLSRNRISQLPAGILDMPQLEQLNLSETNLPGPLNQFFFRRSELVQAFKKVSE
ncbi:leucine-rich repeat domain-containing protein [Fibrella forsythiae]|uniref:Disease resistance R13L4/SHOC-2-like LRR domain-containing protein n=1 Tax=Fibrella forsythiae TaxID=2817061 RepID=A0ABS3JDI4_9BACT|nr:hypothetical protein [Fibrella forsythiae]MBO0948065.1 hypothetical protein [Fibrella forsythiae]